MIYYVLADTTHFVPVPSGFVWVVIPPMYLYILTSKFHQNPFRAFEGNGGSKISFLHYLGYWLLQQLRRPCERISLENAKVLSGSA